MTNPDPGPVGPYGEPEYTPAEAGELIAGVLDQLDQAGVHGPWNAPDNAGSLGCCDQYDPFALYCPVHFPDGWSPADTDA